MTTRRSTPALYRLFWPWHPEHRINVYEPDALRLPSRPTIVLVVVIYVIVFWGVVTWAKATDGPTWLVIVCSVYGFAPVVAGGAVVSLRQERRVSSWPERGGRRPLPAEPWRYQGKPISDLAARELEDARARFEHTARLLADDPQPRVSMRNLRPTIDAVLYAAAGHARRVTEIDDERSQLDTSVRLDSHRADLQGRRAEHQAAIHRTNRAADALMRAVADAGPAAPPATTVEDHLRAALGGVTMGPDPLVQAIDTLFSIAEASRPTLPHAFQSPQQQPTDHVGGAPVLVSGDDAGLPGGVATAWAGWS